MVPQPVHQMMEEDQWEQLVELEVAGRVELAGMMAEVVERVQLVMVML